MSIRISEENEVVYEIVNKKTSNLDYEYNVIADLMELLARNEVWVELVQEEEE